MRRSTKVNRRPLKQLVALILIFIVGLIVYACLRSQTALSDPPPSLTLQNPEKTESVITTFARQHGFTVDDWPAELIALLDSNPETEEFVLNYPLKKDASGDIDLSGLLNSTKMPLLLQWDARWGYTEYAGELMGLSGCGPTCLSMVCIYLLNDAKYTPKYIAAFSEQNGYSAPGSGSAWTLISEGGKKLGLDVTEIPLVESRIIRNLEVGNPIICVVGPGFFTTTGHFIIMTEYSDGYVRINDPNSPRKTAQTWKLTEVMPQIKNLWVCRKPA